MRENERNRNAKTANRPDAKLGAQLYWMASADGTMATPVLLVVDRDMPPGELCIIEVAGFTRSRSMEESGYVVFMANTGNGEGKRLFAKWYVETIVRGTLEKTRKQFSASLKNKPALVIFDGEAKQLKEMTSLFAAELAVALGYDEKGAKNGKNDYLNRVSQFNTQHAYI